MPFTKAASAGPHRRSDPTTVAVFSPPLKRAKSSANLRWRQLRPRHHRRERVQEMFLRLLRHVRRKKCETWHPPCTCSICPSLPSWMTARDFVESVLMTFASRLLRYGVAKGMPHLSLGGSSNAPNTSRYCEGRAFIGSGKAAPSQESFRTVPCGSSPLDEQHLVRRRRTYRESP